MWGERNGRSEPSSCSGSRIDRGDWPPFAMDPSARCEERVIRGVRRCASIFGGCAVACGVDPLCLSNAECVHRRITQRDRGCPRDEHDDRRSSAAFTASPAISCIDIVIGFGTAREQLGNALASMRKVRCRVTLRASMNFDFDVVLRRLRGVLRSGRTEMRKQQNDAQMKRH